MMMIITAEYTKNREELEIALSFEYRKGSLGSLALRWSFD